jgi:hypothetical protein
MPLYQKRTRLQRFTGTAISFGPTGLLKITLTGATTFASVSGGKEGEVLTLVLQQDGTGSRLVTWPAEVIWIGGSAPTLATGAWDLNFIEFRKIGSSYHALSLGASALAAEV